MNYIDISYDNKDSVTMENYGTETSATSSFIPPNMNGGGWSLFGNENNQKAIQACKEHEFAALSFLIRHDMITDYSIQDRDTGSTILHCVARHYSKIPEIQNVLTKILTNDSVRTFINIQDINGNTPLHIALDNGNQLLCNVLIKAGADTKIRNKMNKYIGTDDEYSVIGSETSPDIQSIGKMSATSPSVFAPKTEGYGSKHINKNDNSKNYISDLENSDANDIVTLLFVLNKKQQPNIEYSADMPSTFRTPDGDVTSEVYNTDKFLNDIIASKPMKNINNREQLNMVPVNLQPNLQQNDINLLGGSNTISGSRRMNLYSDFEDLMGGSDRQTTHSDRRGNETSDEYPYLKQSYRNTNRSTAIRDNENDMEDYRQMSRATPATSQSNSRKSGSISTRNARKSKSANRGKSQSKSKSKQTRSADDDDENLDYDYDSDKDYDQDAESRSLSRQIKSQVDQIHERTIEKIRVIMNVDSDIAKNYKNVLYRKVKADHPELGGYERAIEMEKLATRENLEKIDINKVIQETKEYIERKQKEREEQGNTSTATESTNERRKQKKRAPRKTTDTSSVSVISESGLSPTSDGWY